MITGRVRGGVRVVVRVRTIFGSALVLHVLSSGSGLGLILRLVNIKVGVMERHRGMCSKLGLELGLGYPACSSPFLSAASVSAR